MSTPNKLLKSKRERETDNSNKKKKSVKLKKASKSQKIETESNESDEYEAEEENIEGTKQENSLGQLTKNFLQYIKKRGRVNININDLVKDLKVKKRRIYDITNVLQGIGYIEKNGKNEIIWRKNITNPKIENTNETPEDYKSNYDDLKAELKKLKNQDTEIEDILNKFKDEFNILSRKQDFSKYGYITFNDISNLSKNEELDFIIIKATKGTVINVIDDEESKKAYSKIKMQMENGKIKKNEKLLSTLENLHHIFFSSQDEKLKIYRVDKGEICEAIKGQQISENNGDINKNTTDNSLNNNFISNESNNSNETKNIENQVNNNRAIKEKESSFPNNNKLNIKNIENKSNKFNFGLKLEKDNINGNNINNSNNSVFKFNNNKQIFTFENETQNPNKNLNLFFSNSNLNKISDNKDNNNELIDIKNSGIGLSSMFQQK
jgi:transcription factor E2F3